MWDMGNIRGKGVSKTVGNLTSTLRIESFFNFYSLASARITTLKYSMAKTVNKFKLRNTFANNR